MCAVPNYASLSPSQKWWHSQVLSSLKVKKEKKPGLGYNGLYNKAKQYLLAKNTGAVKLPILLVRTDYAVSQESLPTGIAVLGL